MPTRHGTSSLSPLPNRVREALRRAKEAAAQFRTEAQPLLAAKEQELNLALQRLAEAERAQVQLERDIQSARRQHLRLCATNSRSFNVKPHPATLVEESSSSPLTGHSGSVNLLVNSQTSSFGSHDVVDAFNTHGLGNLYGRDVLPLDLTTATECGQRSYPGYLCASVERPQDPPAGDLVSLVHANATYTYDQQSNLGDLHVPVSPMPASTFVTAPAHRTLIHDTTLDEPLSADLIRGSPLQPPQEEIPPRLEPTSHSVAPATAASPEDDLIVFDSATANSSSDLADDARSAAPATAASPEGDLIVFDSATANSSSDLADDAHLEPPHSSVHGIDGIGTDSPVVSNSSEDSLTPSLKQEFDYSDLPEASVQHALLDSDVPRSLPCALLDHRDDSDQPCNSGQCAEALEIHHVLLTPISGIVKDYSTSSVAPTHRLGACSSTSNSAQPTLHEFNFGLGLGSLHARSNPRLGDAIPSRDPLVQDASGLMGCRKIRHPRISDVYPPIRPPGGW